MSISEVKFLKSSSSVTECPDPNLPEYAFLGRSNVGKSSLINALTNRKNLAKISARPGKTQLINHFIINNSWYLVDLPGYGWAKISKSEKEKWENMTYQYIKERKNLMCIFILVDSKIPAQKIDIEFMSWLGKNEIPFVIVFTKTDKLPKTKVYASIKNIKKEFLNHWEELPKDFVTSSEKNTGMDEILKFIEETNQVF